jgi:NACHT domain
MKKSLGFNLESRARRRAALTNAVPFSNAAGEFGKKLGGDVYETIKSTTTKALKKIKVDFELGFSNYIKYYADHLINTKTIINRYQPVNLIDIYEESLVQIRNESRSLAEPNAQIALTEDDMISDEGVRHSVITGTAGSGKSFLMKRTFLRYCELNLGYLPIFIELRTLNNVTSSSIIDKAVDLIAIHVDSFDREQFQLYAKRRKMVFILDGFDELYSGMKERIAEQINNLGLIYPLAKIFVSSRPDERFMTWTTYTEYKILPLNKTQCLSLISKARHPQELKSKFYKVVDERLFKSHAEYLSNPLLIYVMLLTSDQFSDFPEEISEFYFKAFEMLYQGHDVMKSGDFVREVKCPLKQKEVEEIFGYFCALSYKEEMYDYTASNVKEVLSRTLNILNYKLEIDDLVFDLSKNYCLLIQDGLIFSFLHRSFQEYFAALCLTKSEVVDYFSYNREVLFRVMDSTRYFSIVREIGREKFERRFLQPIIDEFIEDASPVYSRSARKFMNLFYLSFTLGKDGRINSLRYGKEDFKTKWYVIDEILDLAGLGDNRFNFPMEKLSTLSYGSVVEEGVDLLEIDLQKLPEEKIKTLELYRTYREKTQKLREYSSNRKNLQKLNSKLFGKRLDRVQRGVLQ